MSEQTTDASEGPNAEAARFRRRLREVEAERDALTEKITAMRTRTVERLAGDALAQPSDLLALGGVTVDDLCDDEGFISPDKVSAAVASLLEARPGLAPVPPPPTLNGGAVPPVHEPERTTWAQVLNPRHPARHSTRPEGVPS